ncbi:uncharacterized protein BCR38DRAFT_138646 [Pseudomassariella vexata]|uniref:Uncharacterized protein n=1 Tax=Pseudomassariella vexata TaxID=1141098 RepID=A0A1Y2EB31_9PEZI|nr:uncharacterized protein BCR38DRAFT_138646 [Pseudomassariella vexata]ORY68779.1 hypothetical protein BCR38DRAFT_138646 [Pseudomassariella vexata]
MMFGLDRLFCPTMPSACGIVVQLTLFWDLIHGSRARCYADGVLVADGTHTCSRGESIKLISDVKEESQGLPGSMIPTYWSRYLLQAQGPYKTLNQFSSITPQGHVRLLSDFTNSSFRHRMVGASKEPCVCGKFNKRKTAWRLSTFK